MNALGTWLVLALAAGALATAQTPPNSKKEKPDIPRLAIVETKALQQTSGTSIIPPGKCDEDGNVYVRFFGADPPPKAPVYKFTPKGERVSIYSIASDPSFQPKGTGVLDFTIDKSGHVFQLAAAEDGYYVLEYNKDGGIKTKTRLQAGFAPSKFEVFDSGEFLITGVNRGSESSPSHTIGTAIFDRSGTLLRKVEVSEDKPFSEAAGRGDAEFVEPGQIGSGNFAAERGQVARAEDGNIYVVRWSEPAKVYAIAPSGEVVRSFEVTPKWPGRKPDAIFAHGNRLAVEYAPLEDDRRALITLVSLDGQEQAMYDISGLGSSLVCYGDPERFALFAGKRLLFAEPR